MKYSFVICQKILFDIGLQGKLDIVDLALFDAVYQWFNDKSIPHVHMPDGEYIEIKHGFVNEQCPILGIRNRESFRKRMLKLCDACLIDRYVNNQAEGKSLYKRGAHFNCFDRDDYLPTENATLPLKVGTPATQSWHNNIDIVSTKVDTTPTENNNPIILFNDKDIPTKETSKERRFVKPTLEQVKAYCEERGNNIDPQHFIDYYESNGWMVGRTHMKDWKAAIRTWERKEVKQLTTPRYGNTINQSGNGVAAAEQPRQRTYTGRF